jgi:hypothetical protein
MLGSAWHQRQTFYEQERRFSQLALLNEITLEWFQVLKMSPLAHPFEGVLSSPTIADIQSLHSLLGLSLADFLDDTCAEEILTRLDHHVWKVQTSTLQALIKKTPVTHQPILENTLEQATWRLGRRMAEQTAKSIADHTRNDLRVLFRICFESPFFPMGQSGVLIKRAIPNEVQLELRYCPHQKMSPEMKTVADSLCRIHSQWFRGYIYELNPRISIETKIGNLNEGKRCEHGWQLIHPPHHP